MSRVVWGACVCLVLAGCDAFRPSSTATGPMGPEEPLPIDPQATGSDDDVGAGDLGPSPVELHGQLRVEGTALLDAHGQPVQLRGVSSMWLNWEDDGFAEDLTALKWMRNNWGLTVVRASMGVEPDGAYLSDPDKALLQVERIVDNAIEAGVYVIIDWHDHNALEHPAEAVAFFSEVAARWGHVPNVLYETFNEPLAVNWSTDLKPYHESVVDAIRMEDPDGIAILGTPQWSQNLRAAAADPLERDNVMYTLHFYACTHGESLRGAGNAALAQDLAVFVSEWGATHADGGLDGKVCLEEAALWHDWMDANAVSWTAWKLDNCQSDSSCLLAPNAPLSGGWTEQFLRGHALFVRARMQAGADAALGEMPEG